MNIDNNSKIYDTEIFISKALRVGVLASAFFIGLGFLLFVITGNSGYPSNTFPTSPVQILTGLIEFKSFAIILTGLLILILTPVFRVGISILTFLKEKDYLYVVITSIVFLILAISFILGKVE